MSIVQISARTGPKLFRESVYKMKIFGQQEDSRNGLVQAIESPVVLRLLEPKCRVLTDPVRDANPFFHVMEFIWMMAGSDNIVWISQFNKNMMKFSDDGQKQHGAYGFRWRRHWTLDQVKKVIGLIRKNPQDRRLVINMWDPSADLGHVGVDVPCNTQLLFRVVEGELQMTVVNRSNDLIWGALGANLCHMTMLQELIANACDMPVGTYYVFTQNLHMYHAVPNFDYYAAALLENRDIYEQEVKSHVPLLQPIESYSEFVADCESLVNYGGTKPFLTFWMRKVGKPIYDAWFSRNQEDLDAILANDWRIACSEWVGRRRLTLADKRSDHNSVVFDGKQMEVGVDISSMQSGAVASMDYPQCDVGSSSTESCADGSVSS